MKIQNLYQGQVLKNYKELCAILDINVEAGNSKKAQLKELERYVKYHKEGNKFIIDEIYEVVQEKVENRGGNNVKYKEDFRKLMINMLNNDKSENMLISKGSLYEAMNLVNENYKLGKQSIDKLSKIIEVPKEYISDFYGENNKKIRETTERNLSSLRAESILMFDIVTAVAIDEVKILYNELGTPICKNGQILHHKETKYRKASKEEKQVILLCEEESKAELGFSTNQEIFAHGEWDTYTKLIKEKLDNANVNINFYYSAYEITWNSKSIEKKYKELDLHTNYGIVKSSINNTISQSIKESCQSRHDKSKNIDTTNMKKYKSRKVALHASKDYVTINDKLTDMLVSEKAMKITFRKNPKIEK